MLMGTNWDMAKNPLLNIYTARIRLVIEYRGVFLLFCFCFRQNPQNSVRSPTFIHEIKAKSICLLHSCREMPLHVKHKLLSLKYKTHLLTFCTHLTLSLISDSWLEFCPGILSFSKFQHVHQT